MESKTITPAYGLYIPYEIRILKDITRLDRELLAQIAALDNDNGCHAMNKTLARFIDSSPTAVSRSVNKMHKLGYITENAPCEKNGYRTFKRVVRSDLKYNKGALPKSAVTDTKKATIPTKKGKHIYKEEKEVLKEEYSIINEEKIVQEHLLINFKDKLSVFLKIKETYESCWPIKWTDERINDLVKMCNRLYTAFSNRFDDLDEEDRTRIFVSIFLSLVGNRPKFFYDSLPSTFLRYWDRAIQHNELLKHFGKEGLRKRTDDKFY